MYSRHFDSRGRRPSPRFHRPVQRNASRQTAGMRGEYIDPSRFINKAAAASESQQHVTPDHAFRDFAIDEELKRAIAARGFVTPTPIQDKAISSILEGRDVVGIANTGTGKTGAFLIPLIQKIRIHPRERVIIIVPTRELAIQIDEEFRALARGMRIFSVCSVGGVNIGPQVRDLGRPHNIVIGTPGRIKDLVNRKIINLAGFKTVVLDEADRMLDMGFINDMRFLMAGMPQPRHTLFFSATLSRDIEHIIGEFLHNPITVSVKVGDTSKNVDQDVVRVESGMSKIDVLRGLLSQEEFSKVLIFGRTKHGVEKLSRILSQQGFKAESIHGNKTHSRRQRALGLFRANQVQILVATDVAARGLDIPNVSHVINFDIPATHDDYVHRIGRTGRGDKQGKALTFIE